MKCPFRRFLIILAAGLALGACTLQFNTHIARDGSGTFGWEYSLNKEEQAALAKEGSTPEAFCSDLQSESDLPKGGTTRTERRGDDFFCIVNLPPFEDLEALRQTYGVIAGISINTLELAGNRLAYDIEVNIPADAPILGGRHPLLTWQLTLPGAVGNNNADKVEGNTLKWELKIGERRNIRAESSLGFFDFLAENVELLSVAGACLLCLVGLGVLSGVYWLGQRKRQATA